MSLKLITFKTNQTLLCEVVGPLGEEITIKCPVQVIAQPGNAPGSVMLGFVPFLEFSNEFKTGIDIPRDSILTINTPVLELENQYNKLFGSGIQIAPASVLSNA